MLQQKVSAYPDNNLRLRTRSAYRVSVSSELPCEALLLSLHRCESKDLFVFQRHISSIQSAIHTLIFLIICHSLLFFKSSIRCQCDEKHISVIQVQCQITNGHFIV